MKFSDDILAASDVSCEGVTKRFAALERGDIRRLILSGEAPPNGFDALKGVSLDVPVGQFLGILGGNGAGKSTLLRTIGGVYLPTSGVVHLGSQVSGIYELGVSNQLMMTGRQYARRWLMLNDMSKKDIDESVEDIHEFTELEDYFDKPVRTYSSGMKARLFFGVATAPSAKIFLIDEVLSVGDIYFTAKCWRRLRSRLLGGASGILATHDWSAVLRLCEKACIMEHGKISAIRPARDTVRDYIVSPDLSPNLARFDIDEGFCVQAISGEDLCLAVPINVSVDTPVSFALSVETFVTGEGWEHILHHDSVEVTNHQGRQTIHVTIPRLPLAAGNYALNLFLSCASVNHETKAITCDMRGWLTGNEIKLVVSGNEGLGGYVLPVKWGLS